MYLIRVNWGQGLRFMNKVLWSKDYQPDQIHLFDTERAAREFADMQQWAVAYTIEPDVWG